MPFYQCSNDQASENKENEIPTQNVPRGRPKKRLSDSIHKKTAKKKIEPLVSLVKEFAEKEGVTFDEVIDMLIENSNKKPKTHISIPVHEATPFFFNEGFSSRSWTELRLFLMKHNVELPTRNAIDDEKKKLCPKIISQEIKSFVTYPDLIQDTVAGIIDCTDSTI